MLFWQMPAVKKSPLSKVVREITGLGLKGQKDLVDAVEKAVKEGVKKPETEDIKRNLKKQNNHGNK